MECACASPIVHVRPSGDKLCMVCGYPIPAPVVPPPDRP